ncbi:metalloendoprotein 1-like [Dorcoceras hygrometricum]|uniref:Metalloendoprotein 1-like n=1 Tax=Dorcoceras hygrometricum TaxID=472368 RepID=A0A2Z7DG09_9LAMI|nr:metalloendoprotein 1-like [Dorcoceras hygrometricum]
MEIKIMKASKVASPYNLLFFAVLIICYADSSNSLSSPLKFLKGLNGTQKGDRANGLIELRKYLQHFGYMDVRGDSMHRDDDFFDETLESAIKEYQNYYSLNTTGFLDEETVALLSKPRCGIPDRKTTLVSEHIDHLSNMSARYQVIRAWPPNMRTLTFFSYMDEDDFSLLESNAIAIAMGTWADVCPIKFRYSGFSNARIRIRFKRWEHGDGLPFDGQGGIVAHAFYPTSGELHFDEDENWVTSRMVKPDELDMQSVALHELGHMLGLGHSQNAEAVMFSIFDYGYIKRDLGRDDILGIRALYPS